jgi:hypothetical protein
MGQKSHGNDVAALKQDKNAANAPQQNFKQKMKNPKTRIFSRWIALFDQL